MGAPKVTAEEWAKRALTVNAAWLEIPTNTKSKFKLRCLTCTHEWVAIGNNIQQGHGCPKCGKSPLSRDEWELRAKNINAIFIEIPKGSDHACRLSCTLCGNEWQSDGDRVSKGHGCPACANHGYSSTKPGTLYVLDFENGSIGYGISNVPDDRLRTHSRRIKFNQARLWNFTDGRIPEKLENSIKRQYAPPFHVDLKVDGFRTEAVGNWPFSEFCKFVDMLIEGEAAHA